jgi:hypothetical protein
LHVDRLITINLGCGRGRDKAFKVKTWQLNQIVFIILVEVKHRNARPVDPHRSIEAGLLAIVSLEPDTIFLIPNVEGCNRWMVTDLFCNKARDTVFSIPVAEK